jgi:hypothetical protein
MMRFGLEIKVVEVKYDTFKGQIDTFNENPYILFHRGIAYGVTVRVYE